MSDTELPANGWWPEEFSVCQWLIKNGRQMAQIVRTGKRDDNRWRAYSMIELSASGTTGKPLGDSTTLEEAKQQCVDYAEKEQQ